MSISLNNASIPVDSHPLSPDELSSGGRPDRRRARGRDGKQTSNQRPVTSYFAVQKPVAEETESSNGYAHRTYSSNHARRTTADWDGSVRGFSKRKQHTKEPLRPQDTASTSTRASTLSLVWDRPSVPLFIVGPSNSAASSERVLSTPPGTPIQRPIFTLSPSRGQDASNQTLHDLPVRAASHVLSTPFHSLSDPEIQNAISNLSVLSEEDNANVKHPYHSALRVLSEAVNKLSRARIELEDGRRKLAEKQTRVREVVKESLHSTLEHEPGLAESVLAILDEPWDLDSDSEAGDMSLGDTNGEDGDEWSQQADGRFSLTDSLSVALSEDLTPTFHDTHPQTPSPAMSLTPPDSEPPDRDPRPRVKPAAPSFILSAGSSRSLFTPSTDDLAPERDGSVSPAEAFSISRTPSPAPGPAPLPPSASPSMGRPHTKSRANSSASLSSMTSSTSKGLGDWMGWFGKAHLGKSQHREPSRSEDAIAEDAVPGVEDSVERDPEPAPDKPRAEEKPAEVDSEAQKRTLTQKQVKEGGTATMRLANGMLSAFRMGSASPQHPTPLSTASPHKPSHKRKTSVSVLTRSVPPSALSSPILGAFTMPPPPPAPPVTVSAPVSAPASAPASTRFAPESHHDDEGKVPSSVTSASVSITDGEAASVLSSGPSPKDKEPEEPIRVQGSSLRALCNATRVMTSDPASILVDHGQDVGELVTQLAWELVKGVRDSGVTFKEPVKPKHRVKHPLPGPEHAVVGEEDQTVEGKRKTKGMMVAKNFTTAAAGSGGAVEKARKASALGTLASPLLGGFGTGSSKARASSTSVRDENLTVPAASAAGASSPSAPVLSPGSTAGALSVALESIIPATAKPPTQYLARTYTSLISPDFKPPTSFGGFVGDRFATREDAEGSEPITDRYGFVYEVSSYDVLLLDRALRASNSAPGCLTGIKVADREEDDDWPADDDAGRAREFEVARGSCDCVDGVRLQDQAALEGHREQDARNGESEVASMVSTSSSKRSSKRISVANTPLRTLSLSAPLKIASLDYLPSVEEGTMMPTHACPNTVRALVACITDVHDQKQAKLKLEWDSFLRARRDMKPIKASTSTSTRSAASSGGAAAMLGLGSRGAADDVEELRQSEGLVGFSQMGLASNQSERREFGRLVRGGIPLVYRAKVWLECSGALEMAEPGAFRGLLEDAIKEGGVAIGEIEKDVGRTMPLNVFFGGDGVGVDKLRRVLRAYSRRNPDVGYCQGMNLVASTLLLVHADEEDAFWNLSCIIEKHLPEDFFSPSLLVSRACPLVLLDYVHDLMPTVFNHLTELGVDLPAICFSWFLSLFTDCLPVETLFRVWDVFIVDGLDVLFRIALSILRINEAELLQAKSVPALYVTLESLPTRMWEVDKLLKHEVDLRPYVVNADIVKKRDVRVKELKELSA